MQKRTIVELCLFLIAVVWALNFSVIKSSLDEIDPLSYNGLRFIFAAVVVWAVLLWNGQSVRIPRKDWLPLLGMGVLGNLVYQGFFIIGIDYTLSANAAVMLGTIPIWVALLAHFFSDEKMNVFKTAGVMCAFGGILFIIAGGQEEFSFGSDTFIGDAIMIMAAAVWALFTILSRPFLKRYTPLQFSAVMSTIGCVLLLIVGLPNMIELNWQGVSYSAYAGVLYSGALAIGAAYIIWNYGLQTVGAVRSATYQNLVPVLGLFFGVILLNEQLSLMQYLGSALVVAGIVLARWRRGKAIAQSYTERPQSCSK